MISVWVPDVVVPLIDAVVVATDSDRSKFVRAAIREKLLRSGQAGAH